MWLCAPTLAHLCALQTIDASIHRAYIHLIRTAKRYLYLENQVRPLLYCAVLSTAGCWQAAGMHMMAIMVVVFILVQQLQRATCTDAEVVKTSLMQFSLSNV